MSLPIESERKFKVIPELLPQLPPGKLITSGYYTRPDAEIEVRIVHVLYAKNHPTRPGDEYARIGFKGPGGEHRVEWEPGALRGVEMQRALDMLTMAPARTIKTRHDLGGWELDVYHGGASGQLVVEWESSEHGPIPYPLPAWVGDEVTGQVEFKNASVAWSTGRR